jgi:hypothetical protein
MLYPATDAPGDSAITMGDAARPVRNINAPTPAAPSNARRRIMPRIVGLY